MKLSRSIYLVAFAAALTLPLGAYAAKGDRKKNQTPATPAFATVDTDGDGSISEAEYVAAMKSSSSEEAAKSRFAALDKDHNGKLSSEEYGASATTAKKKKPRKKSQE